MPHNLSIAQKKARVDWSKEMRQKYNRGASKHVYDIVAGDDFFLFPYVKNKTQSQRFSTPEEALDAFRMHVSEIPQSEWQKCFDIWFKRKRKCIDLNGQYFENQ